MSARQIDRYLAQYAAKVAAAVEQIDQGDPGPGETPFGTYYIARISFGFDGDPVPDVRVIPDEHGGYCVEVGVKDGAE